MIEFVLGIFVAELVLLLELLIVLLTEGGAKVVELIVVDMLASVPVPAPVQSAKLKKRKYLDKCYTRIYLLELNNSMRSRIISSCMIASKVERLDSPYLSVLSYDSSYNF